jgi:NAD(P)-dependent dehydrogenase (short-subunit alcohol dehydrogenase family)
MTGRLTGKRIIVTGAATGIGRSVATAFAEEGARVVIGDIAIDEGRKTASAIGADFTLCDVSSGESVKQFVDGAAQTLGGIDVVVNNAGLQFAGPIETFDEQRWDALMKVNVRGIFLITKHAVPHLRAAGGGSIINTASLAAKRGGPGIAAYAASKGAVMAFTTATALELAPHNIRANSVCPGFIDTPFNQPAIDFMGGREAQAVVVKRMVPLGRQATPDEVAPLYVYLASDESRYVTAQALSIDGGVYN